MTEQSLQDERVQLHLHSAGEGDILDHCLGANRHSHVQTSLKMRFSSGDDDCPSCVRVHKLIDELVPALRALAQQLIGKHAMSRALYIQERQAAARAEHEEQLECDAWRVREEQRQRNAARYQSPCAARCLVRAVAGSGNSSEGYMQSNAA